MDIDSIDIERLRDDLVDHFTAVMVTISPVAIVDLSKIQSASSEEIVKIAVSNGFQLKNYLIDEWR